MEINWRHWRHQWITGPGSKWLSGIFLQGICGLAGKTAQRNKEIIQLPFIVIMNKKCLLPGSFWIFCNLPGQWRRIWKNISSLGSFLYRKWGCLSPYMFSFLWGLPSAVWEWDAWSFCLHYHWRRRSRNPVLAVSFKYTRDKGLADFRLKMSKVIGETKVYYIYI